MRRSLIYLAQLAVFVAVAVWLVENPGDLRIDWLGWRLETTFALFLVVIAGALWMAAVGWRAVLATVKAPFSLLHSRSAHRREAGYRALVQGMAAVAVGDGEEAKRLAREADRLLREPGLTRLLSAQAALLSGDAAAAAKYFAALRDDKETAFIGLVGLMRLADARGDAAHVLELAEEAYTLRPESGQVATTRVYGLARAERWVEAQSALYEAVKRGQIPRPQGRHHRAALLVERARLADKLEDALGLAAKARESVADFVPAIAAEARLLAETGRKDKARRLIHDVWPSAPHPELAAILRGFFDGEAASFVLRKVQAMTERLADHPESRLAVAETALDGEFWGEARAQLAALADEDVGPRACALWARLEEEESGDVAAARRWLERAAYGPGDSAWTCDSCGAASTAWSAKCGHCGAFDTLQWARPPRVALLPPDIGHDADADGAANNGAGNNGGGGGGGGAGPVVDVTAERSRTVAPLGTASAA